MPDSSPGFFRILAIDGGGFRGIYAARMLAKIEEHFALRLADHFDLLAGTSTGAIIAAGLACNLPASNIVSMYERHGKRIFPRRLPGLGGGMVRSRYGKEALRAALKDSLPSITLGEIKKPLILPSTNIGQAAVHVFKSGYNPRYFRDKNVPLVDAVMASCAAPTYFDPQQVDSFLLADGGLWANSPGLVAVMDALRVREFNRQREDLKVCVVGTGRARRYYSQNPNFLERHFGWGILGRWRHAKLVDTILGLQSESATNHLKLLLEDKGDLLLLNFESDQQMPLDDFRAIDDLRSRADHDFAHRSPDIARFLGVTHV